MKLRTLLLPAGALTGAALLLAPREATGFSLGGGSLSLSQRDFRIFDNFTDASANNNVTPDTQFPGYTGAEMAIWKGSVEWGSGLHGNGGGDPHQPAGVGSGGANFDPSFQGNATGVGTTNENIHSEIGSSCGGGTLAFTELPISDGWRIRYCPEWSWADGPGTSVSGIDLQGIACHEYGHALGLGHTGVSGATMFPSVSGTGVSQRSIAADDISGIQAVYGVKSGSKPAITAVTVNGTQVTITGTNFSATNNEVWFTQDGQGGTGTPIKLTGVTSGGTSITVTAPGTAGPGDVLVRNNGTGHANLSNAFPADIAGFPCGITPYGVGLGGVNLGTLASSSSPSVGTSMVFNMSGFLGNGIGFVFISANQASAPLFGGTLLVDLGALVAQLNFTVVGGSGSVSFPIAGTPGAVAYAQGAMRQPGTQPQGWGLTNGLQITTCP